MQNRKFWEKIKKVLGSGFSKKAFITAALFVAVHGIVTILGVTGVMHLVRQGQKSEVIVLPTAKPPEEIFTRPNIGSIADKAVTAEPEESIENEPETKTAATEAEETVVASAPATNVEKEEFYLDFGEGSEILKDYTGEKLVKSKTMGDWRVHNGIDVKAETLSDVKVSFSGTVSEVYDDASLGRSVKITHEDGFTCIYSNLDKNTAVNEGDEVKKGDIIGRVGDSSISEKEEAPHLHVELLKDGEQINPRDYIKS